MSNVIELAPDEATDQSSTATVSLLDALFETDEGDSTGTLEIIRIGTDASFVSLFTEDAVPVAAHYLEATETWAGTYAQCTGDGCPACRAGLTRTEYLLLPVVDRLDGAVKVQRMNRQKGPGKLLTELGQVLRLPNRDDLVIRITRNRNFVHKLEIEAETAPDPDVTPGRAGVLGQG